MTCLPLPGTASWKYSRLRRSRSGSYRLFVFFSASARLVFCWQQMPIETPVSKKMPESKKKRVFDSGAWTRLRAWNRTRGVLNGASKSVRIRWRALAVSAHFFFGRCADCCSQLRIFASWRDLSQRDWFSDFRTLTPFFAPLTDPFCCWTVSVAASCAQRKKSSQYVEIHYRS